MVNGQHLLVRIEPEQLDGFEEGARFGVWWLPVRREPRGGVLCVQPLGAERSAARHALACQAWRLAARGWAVLLVDLYGTGDSPGDLGEATLERWRRDLLRAAMLTRQRHVGRNVLWGVRGGALLAADIAVALDQLVDAYVFWQAPDHGARIVATLGEGLAPGADIAAALRQLRMQAPPAAEHGALPAALFVEFRDDAGTLAEVSPETCALTQAWLEAGYLATPRPALAPAFWIPGGATALREVVVPHDVGAPPLPLGAFITTEEFLEDLQ